MQFQSSAERIAYTEQRETGTGDPSGKFRSLMMDVFGQVWSESTAFEIDRESVAAYRGRVMRITAGMPQFFNNMLGLNGNP